MSREQFEANVARIVEYIHAGDAFQVVPSQRFSAPAPVEAFSIYRGLRTVNPSPYMYFLEFGDFQIAGASPEPLVKVTGRRVETRPIAGTYPRGANEEEDRAPGRGAARRPEGARRARDAGRPRPQRPRPGLRVRDGQRRRVHGRRDLLARLPHRQPGLGHAARRGQRDGRAARDAARRHALRGAEGAGDADHRRARAAQALLLRRRDRLPELHRRPRHRDPHPHRGGQGRPGPRPGRRRHGRRREARLRVPRVASTKAKAMFQAVELAEAQPEWG